MKYKELIKNKFEDLKYKSKNLAFYTALYIPLATLQVLPMTADKLIEHTTTKYAKVYNVHVEDIDTTRLGGFGMQYFHYKFSGDTNTTIDELRCLDLIVDKNYEIQMKTFGFFGERTEIREIIQIKQ
ncbi:MAG: hypothetical protein WC758_03195 [Candidatus Woesearchaeota archaeon]|jgi:hypothetical protein